MAECKKFHIEDIFKTNGKKSYAGLAGVVAGMVVQNYYDYTLGNQIMEFGLAALGLGLVHKADKAIKAVTDTNAKTGA
jgi:hypothetical protein